MAARTEMAALIERVRLLIADPAGDAQHFADGDLQAILDSGRAPVYGEYLTPVTEIGQSLPTVYHSQFAEWDSAAALVDAEGVALTPTTSDYMAGRWTFGAGQATPVYASGYVYDIFGAAAMALETWAAALAREYDFSADGGSYKRSQQSAAMLSMAADYRRSGRVRTARIVTSDA